MVNLIRLKKAAEMITQCNYKPNEIAHLVGYSSTAQLGRNFKRQFGVTPSKWLTLLQATDSRWFIYSNRVAFAYHSNI